MPIQSGTHVGPYEILSAIGAGGMGEVYRARDPKLGRDVAIKVLPESFARDADRMARFQREAKVLASLNHPNIATIHGLEDSGDTHALVMELVEGPTLADRIKAGPIPVDEAVRIARQIADALEYAHERGIIHRDLKPANVKVSNDDTVKVLDFGLAKALEGDPSSIDISTSPTISRMATMQGVLLGTAAYMSPEQAKAKSVDRRADIWAFGCVLYEMLTGKQAFTGETVTDTLASIIKEEPDLATLPAATPMRVRVLLQRCLQKDPKQRLRDIGDARISLDEVLSGAPEAASAPATLVSRQKVRERFAWAAAAVFFLAAIGLGAVVYLYRGLGEIGPARFFVYPPEKGTFDFGANVVGWAGGMISPDGRRIAFTARDASGKVLIWIRPLDTLAPQALHGTDEGAFPFWSPDSQSLGFFAQGKLKRIDVAGGPVQTLCDAPVGRGGTWSRGGVILFAPNTGGPLYRVSSAGGDPVAVTKASQGLASHRFPSFLPDGRHFLYLEAKGPNQISGVFVGALDSSESKRLVAADSNALYSSSGVLLFIRQGTLLRQSFDTKSLELAGDPIPVTEQVGVGGGGVGAFSVSENGVLVYRHGPASTGIVQLAWFDRTGKTLGAVGAPGLYRGVDVSRDGQHIAVHRGDGSGGDIWLFDSARLGTMLRLTFDASQDNSMPIWSPDGSRIVFGSLRDGKWGLYQKSANGTGRDELLVESDLPKVPMSWSPDGKFIVYWVRDVKTGRSDEWILPLAGDRKPFAFLQAPFDQMWPQISPDGKWIAYGSDETGTLEIYVRPFPSGEGKWQVSTHGGLFPRWRRDGKELFYMGSASSGKIISVRVDPAGPGFEYGSPSELFDSGYFNFLSPVPYHTFAVSPDGQQFLIPRPESMVGQDAASAPIIVVLNWAAGLKK